MPSRRSNSNADQEPPAKRPRLKLNLRKPSSNDGDTIAVSRPKRASATRSRYSEDAMMWDDDDDVEEPKVKQSPTASSGLSSPASVTASVRHGMLTVSDRRDPDRGDSERRDSDRRESRESYSHNFLAYYVEDGGDAEEEEEAAPVPRRQPAGGDDDAGEEAAPRPKRQLAKPKSAAKEKQPREPRKKQASARPSMSPVNSQPPPANRVSMGPPPQQTARPNTAPQKVPAPRSKPARPHAPPALPLAYAQNNQRPPPVQHARHPPGAVQPPHVQPPRPVPQTLLAENIAVKYHASVDVKVKKLQALSASLTNFGGVPPARKPPAPENGKKLEDLKTKPDEKKDITSNDKGAPVDKFLAMFDDESEDEDNDEPERERERERDDPKRNDPKRNDPKRNDPKRHDPERERHGPERERHGPERERDDPEIDETKNNETKKQDTGDQDPQSQVKQNRYLEHTGVPDGPLTFGIQFIMDALHSWAEQRIRQRQQHMAAVFHARMLPPAVPNSGNNAASYNSPTTVNGPTVPDLGDTPEGQAIAAFRDVVESGCLQVNLILPADLAKAVSHLYLQIDHLINQGNRTPEPTYYPMSYSAQIIAHQKRLDRFKDDQARRQQASIQQGMHQMYGMAPPPMPNGYSQQVPFQDPMYPPSGRRRSTPGQSHARLPPRGSLPSGASGPSQFPANRNFAGNPSALPGASRPDGPRGSIGEEMARLLYPPNFRLPLSGQTMNFSFAHPNPAAIQAFGTSAFSTTQSAPGGPTLPSQAITLPSQAPTLPSQAMGSPPTLTSSPAPPSGHEQPGSRKGKNNVKSERELRATNDPEAHAHPPNRSSGFTAVNAPARPARDSRSSSPGGKTTGLSHSDAVVVDD